VTTAWPDMFRATRFRLALWPYYLLAGEVAYRRLWIVTFGAGTAAFATRIAFLVAVTESGQYGLGPAQYVLYEGVAAFFCAPLCGLLIDWRSPRQVLVATEFARFSVLMLFALAGEPALLAPLIIILGGCAVLHQAARDAALRDTLPARRVTRASGLDQAAAWGAVIAGPLIGVALVTVLDLRVAAVLLALAHLLLLLLARRLPRRGHDMPVAERGMLLPWMTLRRTGVLVLIVFGLSALTGSVWIAVAPQMIADVWRAAPGWIGVQVTVAGIAAIAGSLAAPALIARIGIGPAMVRLCAGEAVAFIAYALSPTLAASTVAVGFIGLIAGAFLAAFYAHLQHSADGQERGRLFALVRQIDAAALLLAGLVASLMTGLIQDWQILGLAAALYLAGTFLYALCSRGEQRR
jgi:MFS family permease